MTIRAFIAVDFEAGARLQRLLRDLASTKARLRVIPPENLHITLKFLGNTEEGRVDAILEALKESVDGVASFTLTLTGTGAFPSLRSPRVLWVGVKGGGPLITVATRLEDRLQGLGFPKERRRFSPHLTVARVKGSRGKDELIGLVEGQRDTDFGIQRVEAVKLKRSELRPTGAVYSEVARVTLD